MFQSQYLVASRKFDQPVSQWQLNIQVMCCLQNQPLHPLCCLDWWRLPRFQWRSSLCFAQNCQLFHPWQFHCFLANLHPQTSQWQWRHLLCHLAHCFRQMVQLQHTTILARMYPPVIQWPPLDPRHLPVSCDLPVHQWQCNHFPMLFVQQKNQWRSIVRPSQSIQHQYLSR